MDSRTSVSLFVWAFHPTLGEVFRILGTCGFFRPGNPTEVNLKKVKKSLMVGLPQTDFTSLHTANLFSDCGYIYIFLVAS